MKVAIATEEGRVAQHFGRCEGFVVCTIEGGTVGPPEALASEPHEHGQCSAPDLLARAGVTHLIAGGMGPRAVSALAALGIETYLGIDDTVADAVAALAAGRLVSTPGECDHADGGCSH